MTSFVRSGRAEGILTLTLNRPAKRNALNVEMYQALADELDAAGRDEGIKVIVLVGSGDQFCAGNDLEDFLAAGAGDLPPDTLRFLKALAGADKPIVAGVQGAAVGIGGTMLLHCDYVIMSDDAFVAMPFVPLGLVPEAASSMLLPSRVGHPRAFAMFALGERIASSEALSWGLANRVIDRAQLTKEVELTAGRLSRLPSQALQMTKRLMRDTEAIATRSDAELAQFRHCLGSLEARQAIAAMAAPK